MVICQKWIILRKYWHNNDRNWFFCENFVHALLKFPYFSQNHQNQNFLIPPPLPHEKGRISTHATVEPALDWGDRAAALQAGQGRGRPRGAGRDISSVHIHLIRRFCPPFCSPVPPAGSWHCRGLLIDFVSAQTFCVHVIQHTPTVNMFSIIVKYFLARRGNIFFSRLLCSIWFNSTHVTQSKNLHIALLQNLYLHHEVWSTLH